MRAKVPNLLANQWVTICRVDLQREIFYYVAVVPLCTAQQATTLRSRPKV